MTMALPRCSSFLVLLMAAVVNGSEWSYEGEHGPSHWPDQCASGKSQSPINIPRANNVFKSESPFVFKYYDEHPRMMTLTNNGHSATLTMKPVKEKLQPKVYGGGLNSKYQFSQFHFHWGSSDDHGSEHTLDNRHFPMELHLVHFNLNYGSDLGEAISKSNGSYDTVAVLGVFFEVQERDNHHFDEVVEALEGIHYASQEVHVNEFDLMNVLPRNTDMFYRYNGSLTTPSCNEIVIWTIFKDPVFISSHQMHAFRTLMTKHADEDDGDIEDSEHTVAVNVTGSDHKGELVDNFRNVQPLNNRVIFDIDTSHKSFGKNSAAHPMILSASVASIAVLLASIAI